jgi:hypothetical protein
VPRKTSSTVVYQQAGQRAKQALVGELKRLLRVPAVLDEFPAYQDHAKIRQHAVATMVKLTKHPDAPVAMQAAMWLKDYADALQAMSLGKVPNQLEREQILSDLRGMYTKALARAPLVETLEVQAEPELVVSPLETPEE